MAVYQGARRRGVILPGGIAIPRPTGGRASRRTATSVEAGAPAKGRLGRRDGHIAIGPAISRQRRVGAVIAAIVILFSVAFVSLSQSVRVAATSYDIVRLVSERDRLDALKQDLRSDLDRLGAEPAIRKLGIDHGLGQLGAPLVVPAR